jgi:hypothetical protein
MACVTLMIVAMRMPVTMHVLMGTKTASRMLVDMAVSRVLFIFVDHAKNYPCLLYSPLSGPRAFARYHAAMLITQFDT